MFSFAIVSKFIHWTIKAKIIEYSTFTLSDKRLQHIASAPAIIKKKKREDWLESSYLLWTPLVRTCWTVAFHTLHSTEKILV